MTKVFFSIVLLAVSLGGCKQRQKGSQTEKEGGITFIVTSDMARRGESEQQNIADLLGRFVAENSICFLAVAGDPVHDDGVESIHDEEWNLKIENIYTAPSLHALPWYVISGNHEYNGSIPAILEYSNVSERWNAPSRYFSFTRKIGAGRHECLFIFIDTTPLIDKYRIDEPRSDAPQQDIDAQLDWLKNELSSSETKWTIVIGHHPVYAKTTKQLSERTDMQKRVGGLLETHGADFYIAGHVHNFQHINLTGGKVHYIVNSSASKSREVHETDEVEGFIFGNPDPGFTVFTVSADSVQFSFVNHTGETVYHSVVSKK